MRFKALNPAVAVRTIVSLALLASLPGCGGGPSSPTGPAPTPSPGPPALPSPPAELTPAGGVTLATGQFDLPFFAGSTSAPGFHEVIERRHVVGAADFAGKRTLRIALRDLSRPQQTCPFSHHTSGCATVDWTDNPVVPKTPPDGILLNRIRLRLTSGDLDLFLRESLTLETTRPPLEPT